MSQKTPITVAHGDGIGPEIMEASLHNIRESGAALAPCMGSNGSIPKEFGDALNKISLEGVQLRMVDNRGMIVWPGGMSETFVTDSYRCRFQPAETSAIQAVTHAQVSALYQEVTAAGYDIVKTETLRTFDGQQGFTLTQGQ